MTEMTVREEIELALYKSGYSSYSIYEDNDRYSIELESDMFIGCPPLYRQMLAWDDLKCELNSKIIKSIVVIKTMYHGEAEEVKEVL